MGNSYKGTNSLSGNNNGILKKVTKVLFGERPESVRAAKQAIVVNKEKKEKQIKDIMKDL